MISEKTSHLLLLVATCLLVMIFYFLPPIPQFTNYHQFADQRSVWGIPNVWNVLSNLAIALPGILGLFLFIPQESKNRFYDPRERWIWIGISLSLILTAWGSTYYHLAPDNTRLIWDRIPMTFVFMSLVAALIAERINVTLGLWLWPFLLGMGVYAVLLWYATELQGKGDLRFYIGIQAFAMLVPLIMLISPFPYDRNADLAAVVGCYGLVLLFDWLDYPIDQMTRGVISGHTLKHLAVGLAGFLLIRMVWKRQRTREI